MKDFKLFGQEPAFVVGVTEAGLAMFLAFGWFDLSQNQAGVIVASVTAALGFAVAYATNTTTLSAFTGLAKAILVLAVTFGAPLSDNETASVIAFVTLIASVMLRQNSNSTDTAISNASPGAKKEALQLYALQAAVQGRP